MNMTDRERGRNVQFLVLPSAVAVVDGGTSLHCYTCVPAVITLASHYNQLREDGKRTTADGVEITEALRKLVAAGADVVGFNCTVGPVSIMPLLESSVEANVGAPLAAIPVPYRTTLKEPTFTTILDPWTGKRAFPDNLDCLLCSREDVVKFTQQCVRLKIPYIGLCCGNAPHYTRTMAETLGRVTEASKFSPDMSIHGIYGTDDSKVNTYYTKELPKTTVKKE